MWTSPPPGSEPDADPTSISMKEASSAARLDLERRAVRIEGERDPIRVRVWGFSVWYWARTRAIVALRERIERERERERECVSLLINKAVAGTRKGGGRDGSVASRGVWLVFSNSAD